MRGAIAPQSQGAGHRQVVLAGLGCAVQGLIGNGKERMVLHIGHDQVKHQLAWLGAAIVCIAGDFPGGGGQKADLGRRQVVISHRYAAAGVAAQLDVLAFRHAEGGGDGARWVTHLVIAQGHIEADAGGANGQGQRQLGCLCRRQQTVPGFQADGDLPGAVGHALCMDLEAGHGAGALGGGLAADAQHRRIVIFNGGQGHGWLAQAQFKASVYAGHARLIQHQAEGPVIGLVHFVVQQGHIRHEHRSLVDTTGVCKTKHAGSAGIVNTCLGCAILCVVGNRCDVVIVSIKEG